MIVHKTQPNSDLCSRSCSRSFHTASKKSCPLDWRIQRRGRALGMSNPDPIYFIFIQFSETISPNNNSFQFLCSCSLRQIKMADPGFPGGWGADGGHQALSLVQKPIMTVGNVVTARECFYTCLSFCPQGVLAGRNPPPPGRQANTPSPRVDTPSAEPSPLTQGRPLRRTVCILLECILVWQEFCQKLHDNERNWTTRGPRP